MGLEEIYLILRRILTNHQIESRMRCQRMDLNFRKVDINSGVIIVKRKTEALRIMLAVK